MKHPMTSNEFVDQSMFEQIRVHVDTDDAGLCTHKTQYDGTRDDAREALCERRAQCPVYDCVLPAENVNGTAWYEVVQQDLCCESVLCDWGVQVNLEVLSDSGAARGLTCRQGLRRARHIQSDVTVKGIHEYYEHGEPSRRSLYEGSQWSVTREVSQETGFQARCSVDKTQAGLGELNAEFAMDLGEIYSV